MKGQKSIIRTLTNRSFKANKTRNLIAVFAIVLTTVMFTSLFVLSQSMVENMRNMNFQQAGYNSHLSSSTMTDADMEKIVSHEAVRDYGKSTIIGVAENKELTGRQVEIRYADENYARSSFSYPTTGTMPVQENEIALDTITLDKMGLPYELGQEITLEWRKDLTSDEYTTSTFVLSGYWDGNSAAMASMAWVSEAFVQSQSAGIDQEAQLANGQVFGTVMLHLDLYSDSDLEGAAEQILADTGLSDVSLSPNAAYDATMNQNIIREVLPMAICMVLVFASGYLIIYNIFQISVASDIRFYGRFGNHQKAAKEDDLRAGQPSVTDRYSRRPCDWVSAGGGVSAGNDYRDNRRSKSSGQSLYLHWLCGVCLSDRPDLLHEARENCWQGFSDGGPALHRYRYYQQTENQEKHRRRKHPEDGACQFRPEQEAHRYGNLFPDAGACASFLRLCEKCQL